MMNSSLGLKAVEYIDKSNSTVVLLVHHVFFYLNQEDHLFTWPASMNQSFGSHHIALHVHGNIAALEAWA